MSRGVVKEISFHIPTQFALVSVESGKQQQVFCIEFDALQQMQHATKNNPIGKTIEYLATPNNALIAFNFPPVEEYIKKGG